MFGMTRKKERLNNLEKFAQLEARINAMAKEIGELRVMLAFSEKKPVAALEPSPKQSKPVMSYYCGLGLREVYGYLKAMEDVINLLLENAGLEITETPSTESKIILKPKETPKAAKPKKA